jgi:hypothetical protein
MLAILSLIFSVVSLVLMVVILIDAFKDAIWKGLVGLFCGLYLLYYGLVEFEHENKLFIVGGWIGAGAMAAGLRFAARGN